MAARRFAFSLPPLRALLACFLLLALVRPASAQVKAVITGDNYFYGEHTGNPQEDYAFVYFEAYESQGDIVTYQWILLNFYQWYIPDQPWFDSTVPLSYGDHFPEVEEYGIGLYVADAEGNSDYTERWFQVEFHNAYPVANAGPDQWLLAPFGLDFTLHGSAYDPDGDTFWCAGWYDRSDPEHNYYFGYPEWDPTVYLLPGAHEIWLTVFDTYSNDYSFDNMGLDKVTVTVYGSWIDGLSKSSTYAGEFPPTLTVNGQAFRKGAVITWNGTPLPTTWLSSTQLRTKLTAEQVALAGINQIRIDNPAFDYWGEWVSGGFSNTVGFAVLNRAPALFSLSPSSVVHGSPGFTLTVTGARFVAGSVVLWNGTPLATAYGSSTSLSATVPASLLASAGKATVQVSNPAPGGGVSAGKVFTIR